MATGPEYWPQQSPIDLTNAIQAKLPEVDFDYDEELVGEFDECNFHVKSGKANIALGTLKGKLLKIHLHAPSEHLLDGKDFPIEAHLVHEITAGSCGSKYLVIGLFLKEKGKAKAADSAGKKRDKLKTGPLVRRRKKYFRYEGSLTTDPYSGQVSWVVFRDLVTVDAEYLAPLKGKTMHTARKVKQHARRFLLKDFA